MSDSAIISFALLAAVTGIAYGLYLAMWVFKLDAGNPKMQEIAKAIQEGAGAYMNRQYKTVGIVAAAIFAFTVSWAQFLYPLAFTTSVDQLVLPVGIITALVGAPLFLALGNHDGEDLGVGAAFALGGGAVKMHVGLDFSDCAHCVRILDNYAAKLRPLPTFAKSFT